uniref:Uncharacterized protein n=1 Tax=Chromera velia CCMP2878 TaxID=1169474 RepID=A0A0G4HRU1_9ALVE|eukprot:Cvel_8174.t1-p1 / transcript=Cvel_8174.t1 / gene=Cvel_8174 / organism=Chromera_velia_CCMP2878 / gene_product=hypothetical protein / transcript_product=hypothetical protein / location=Cvel_scaffold445:55681-56433(+) / protein_length=153 / sequence_SO=supercontig / SO=protein_coding / is_pseudo=false
MDSGGQDYTMTGDYDDAADEDYIPPEAQHSKKTLKRNFTAGSNPEEPKIQRGQCTIDKLDGVRTTKGGHQIVPGMAALSLSGAPQMRAGFQRLNPQSARLTNAPFASTRNPNTVIPRGDPTQIPASAAATRAHAQASASASSLSLGGQARSFV